MITAELIPARTWSSNMLWEFMETLLGLTHALDIEGMDRSANGACMGLALALLF